MPTPYPTPHSKPWFQTLKNYIDSLVSEETESRTNSEASLDDRLSTAEESLDALPTMYVPLTQRGAASGVATLDGTTHVPIAQIPGVTTLRFRGPWNATTNTPALVDGAGTVGDTYRIVGGSFRDLGSGNIFWPDALLMYVVFDSNLKWVRGWSGTTLPDLGDGFPVYNYSHFGQQQVLVSAWDVSATPADEGQTWVDGTPFTVQQYLDRLEEEKIEIDQVPSGISGVDVMLGSGSTLSSNPTNSDFSQRIATTSSAINRPSVRSTTTTSTTVGPNEYLPVNSTSAPVTITLPTTPPVNTIVWVAPVTGTNTITIARGGTTDVIVPNATTRVIGTGNEVGVVSYIFDGEGNWWPLLSVQSTKANLASPAFTGTPVAPTASATNNTTQIATTAMVQSKFLSATATLDFPSIAAQTATAITFASLTITVTGAATGDAVLLGPPSTTNAGLIWEGYVSATNTVTIRLGNCTNAAIDPASATWRATVVKS